MLNSIKKTYNQLNLSGNNFDNLHLVIEQLKPVIIQRVLNDNNLKNQLFGDGIDIESEILKPGKQWQKGKIKVELNFKFYPDEPEAKIEQKQLNQLESSSDNNSEVLETEVSPLDDLRQKFNQENQ
ncbi:KGK domain-containing protein [Okeania sp.]|uniref:KGK domain-containing protein n=1 Tax=Okeania sp. TaxID=3100323 RepID=UPI002B4ABA6E|nr:KGK domain-containing protein [Okeania sp.]MEB3340498.1 KGK domain-containing protein [Okeania sp.]